MRINSLKTQIKTQINTRAKTRVKTGARNQKNRTASCNSRCSDPAFIDESMPRNVSQSFHTSICRHPTQRLLQQSLSIKRLSYGGHSCRRQAGQAMPLGIALIMFGILAGLLVFNTGQLVTTKTRVTNTADAAVYSGLVWQTRALNFQSYTNRAMVANQVTIAQAVSLRSWSLYGKIAAENMQAVLAAVPVLNVASKAFQTVMATAEKLIQPVTDVLAGFVNELNGVLSDAQEAMYVATFAVTPEVVAKVITQNDADFRGDTRYSVIQGGDNTAQWRDFTEQYAADDVDAMLIRSDIINRSVDPFSAKRDWEFFSHWFYVTPLVRFKMHKQGETRLVMTEDSGPGGEGGVQWEWKAKDNLSLNARIWRPFRSTKRIEIPIGWGQAFANKDSARTLETACKHTKNESTDKVTEECERWFRWNRSAEYMSDNNIRSPVSGAQSRVRMANPYHGIRAFRDLSQLGNQDKDPRLVLKVEVEGGLDGVATSGKTGIGSLFELQPTGASSGGGQAIAAIASAEVYFQKPLLVDNQPISEYANGYSPYWDVRLIDTPIADHALALQLRGVSPSAGDIAPTNVAQPHTGDASVLPSQRLDSYSTGVYASNEFNADPSTADQRYFDATAIDPPDISVNDVFGDLSDQLTSAAQSLLSGAAKGVKDAGGVTSGTDVIQLEQATDQVVDRLVSLQPDIDAAEAEAKAVYERVRREFEAIKKDVAFAFDAEKIAFEEEVARVQAEQGVIVEQLQASLLEETDAAERKRIIEAIGVARDTAELTPEAREEALAQLLVQVVNERSSTYQIEFETALKVVTLETDIGTSLAEQLRLSCGDIPGDYDIDDC